VLDGALDAREKPIAIILDPLLIQDEAGQKEGDLQQVRGQDAHGGVGAERLQTRQHLRGKAKNCSVFPPWDTKSRNQTFQVATFTERKKTKKKKQGLPSRY
jgi:hypothetical protein